MFHQPSTTPPLTGTSHRRAQRPTPKPTPGSYDVAVYDIDLFDTPAATIDALQTPRRRIVRLQQVLSPDPRPVKKIRRTALPVKAGNMIDARPSCPAASH